MKKLIAIILITITSLSALSLSSKQVKNANTVFITLSELNIKEPKLTFDKHNIIFFKYKSKPNSYYTFIPISYYKKIDNYKVIVSYIKDSKKIFKSIKFNVIKGNYKSETIKVSKSKVTLSKKNKKRTLKEYNEAMKFYNTTTKESYINGDFIYPINSKITSSFGTKRVYNGSFKSYHTGTDFKAQMNTPIKASNNGVIEIVENRFYAGNSIVINHGQGIYSCYFHLNQINVRVGDFVKKGNIIALSGNTGRVTGPHLHFSFRIHGIQVDPLQFIKLSNSNFTN
jgi:murein DD-endopeptidase MepM/ murein hydrolase activator NlpD